MLFLKTKIFKMMMFILKLRVKDEEVMLFNKVKDELLDTIKYVRLLQLRKIVRSRINGKKMYNTYKQKAIRVGKYSHYGYTTKPPDPKNIREQQRLDALRRAEENKAKIINESINNMYK